MDLAALNLRLFLVESEPRALTPRSPGGAGQLWAAVATELAGCVRALGVPADRMDDVLQDLYLPVVERLPPDLSGEDTRRWLFRVAANRCRLEHRQRSRWQRLWTRLATWTTPTQARRQPAEQNELNAEVDEALGKLKEVEREVIVLRYFCGLNSREAGEVLQMPEATVRSHLAKARRQLAKELADWNDRIE